MINAIELAIAVLLLGAVIWTGDAISSGIDGALGEKRMRDRDV